MKAVEERNEVRLRQTPSILSMSTELSPPSPCSIRQSNVQQVSPSAVTRSTALCISLTDDDDDGERCWFKSRCLFSVTATLSATSMPFRQRLLAPFGTPRRRKPSRVPCRRPFMRPSPERCFFAARTFDSRASPSANPFRGEFRCGELMERADAAETAGASETTSM